MTKRILLSFDVEEFDIPEEYGQEIDPSAKLQVTSDGLVKILGLLEKLDITATFFTTVYFFRNQPSLMQRACGRHELASHGVLHSRQESGDFLSSRLELEKLSGKKVFGYRHPRLQSNDRGEILSAGYSYNSSENPIWLPGRYMNLFKPRLPYFSGDLLNIPFSTSPLFRYPLFWLSFKNTPLSLFKMMSAWALGADSHLNIYFHPWEFTDLTMWKLPWYVKRISGDKMPARHETYLIWLKSKAEFVTFSEFAANFKNSRE